MKLRIQGNSLRLRLTQKEVACLRDRGCVESLIEFSPPWASVGLPIGMLESWRVG